MYQKVLAATDLSKHSEGAVRKAAELSVTFGAELQLLLVIEPLGAYPSIFEKEIDQKALSERLRRRGEEELAALGARAGAGGPGVRSFVEFGRPHRVIVEHARKEGIDLIVVGSHGLHGVSAWLVGSCAERVVRGADCDVLVVRRAEDGA